MSEHTSSTPFVKSTSSDQYGKIPLKSWTGKVVSYDSQKDQIESGWGWRYKVRVLGDNSDIDNVGDENLSYAYALLPTTAGSGGAYKLRSVRISQGDMVYGVYGGDGPRLILGVFPRTTKTSISSGKFGTLSGFTGSLKKNGTLSGEFNEQTGPATPGVTPVQPKNYNKATAKDPSPNVEQLGIDPNDDKIVDDVTERTTPQTTDPNKPYKGGKGESMTRGQLKTILSTASKEDKEKVLSLAGIVKDTDITLTGNESDSEIMRKVIDIDEVEWKNYTVESILKAETQGLIESSVAVDATSLIEQGKFTEALNLVFPPEDIPVNLG